MQGVWALWPIRGVNGQHNECEVLHALLPEAFSKKTEGIMEMDAGKVPQHVLNNP